MRTQLRFQQNWSRHPSNRARAFRSGTAAVEFAIVLPVLITILLGVTDFGRFSHSSIAIANAARSGAAYAIMNPFDSGTQTAWETGVTQAVVDELSQSTAFDTSQLTVTITDVIESGGLHRVSVQVTYPFATTVNWVFLPSSFNLQETTVMRGIR
jgi:Flp pilus assembly protein TadG